MKTNEEIQREAQRMLDLGRQYQEEHRGAVSEVVPLPRVLVQFPDVQLSRPADNEAGARVVTRQRHIEAAMAGDGLTYRLMERETEPGAASAPATQAEASEVMVSRAGFDLLHAGYEMVEEDRLFELLIPYSERAERRSGDEAADDREVTEVEALLETHLLPASDRLRSKAEIVEYLEGRLEPGVFIARTIDRLCAREGQSQVQNQRHAIRLTIDES